MLIDWAQARDISIICHLWNYLEPSLKPRERVEGDGRALGGLVVGVGVAGCLSFDEWLHGFLVFTWSAGAL